MKSNIFIFLMLALTITKTSHSQTITAASFGADCPLAQTDTSKDVQNVTGMLSNLYKIEIQKLKEEKDNIQKCFFKEEPDKAKSLNQKLLLIESIAQRWTPKPVPLGLTLSGVQITCNGKENFFFTMDTIFSQLKSETIKIQEFGGEGQNLIEDSYNQCKDLTDVKYKECIHEKLKTKGSLGSLWETKCGKKIDLELEDSLKKLANDRVTQDASHEISKHGLKIAFDEIESLLDRATNFKSSPVSDPCSSTKVKVASGLTNIITAGANLFSTMGPPMTALGTLMIAKPLTQLIQNVAAKSNSLSEMQTSLNMISQNDERPFNIYSCVWFAATKSRCLHDTQYKCETNEPSVELFAPLIAEIDKLTPDTKDTKDTKVNKEEANTETDDDFIDEKQREKYIQTIKFFNEENVQADGRIISRNKLIGTWIDKLGELNQKNKEATEPNTMLEKFFKKTSKNLEDFQTKINKLVNNKPKQDDNTLIQYLGKRHIGDLNDVINSFNIFKSSINDPFITKNKTIYCGSNSPLKDVCLMGFAIDELTADQNSQDVKAKLRQAKYTLDNHGVDSVKLNGVFKSIVENNQIQGEFTKEWEDIVNKRKRSQDTTPASENKANARSKNKNTSGPFSAYAVKDILKKCLMSLHYSRVSNNGHKYNEACGFMFHGKCKKLIPIENTFKAPSLDSTGANDYNDVCKINQLMPAILKNAEFEMSESEKKGSGTICGMPYGDLLKYIKEAD